VDAKKLKIRKSVIIISLAIGKISARVLLIVALLVKMTVI
jgi:hypothetical protein